MSGTGHTPLSCSLVKEAREGMRGVLQPTPLIHSSSFSKLFGFECRLKLENLQKTGSFKARGAYNRLSALTEGEKRRGVVAASSGNHAQGVAWAAALLKVRAVIVMPETAPIIKHVATRAYGGEVVFHGRSFDESYGRAEAIAREEGLVFIPPFDDELVMAGQGTVGLEIMEEFPEVDAVVVPIGGGGLISGIATAVKEQRGSVKVIGVEADASPSCIESLKAGKPVQVPRKPTIADGIAVKRVGEKTFPIIKRYVDEVVAVSEEAIAGAILKLLERKKLIVEGAGAVTLASAMEGVLPRGIKSAVFVLSGGNIDVTTLDRIIRLGLKKEGRIMKVSTVIEDVPGSLARLTAEIAALKANILQIFHLREGTDVNVGSIGIDVILEVEGVGHASKVEAGLREKGYEI